MPKRLDFLSRICQSGPKEPWERARARQDIKSNFYFGSGLGFFGFTLIFGYSTEMLGTGNYPADHKAMKIVNKAPKPAQTVIEEEEEEEDDDSSDSESVAEIEPVFFISRVNLMN